MLLLYALARLKHDRQTEVTFNATETALQPLLRVYGPWGASARVSYPYSRLVRDGLWQMPDRANLFDAGGNIREGVARERDPPAGFTPDVLATFEREPELINVVALHLLEHHFAPGLHEEILEAVGLELGTPVPTRRRDMTFRAAVLQAYLAECCVCGFSLRLVDGLIGVDAAHIRWHAHGGPDEVTNGLALCALHHRLFDHGAITVREDLRVRVARAVAGRSARDLFKDLDGQPVRLPMAPLSSRWSSAKGEGETRHHVTMAQQTCDRLTASKHTPEKCVQAALRFLLDREPKESGRARSRCTRTVSRDKEKRVAEAPRAEIIVRDVTIEDLQEYAALREVQRALWHAGEARGAAVMVGAGFSRHAELPAATSPQPPLWDDFRKEMCRRLRYPHDDGPRDPLRLAEEFRAALGQAALDALIRDLVRDEAWAPSDLHRDLLRLPWSDVLTTNWDTLLERARFAGFERTYEVVRTPADIASTRTPRIVKLHGSLPSHTPFIFAEEDYRTYPRKFAPFVNLAQQILLENELCLIGFSGDDPNFLAWSGWVRDHLGRSARPIRLAGVLNLAPPRRRYLEDLNVTPIDLAPLVAHIDDRNEQQRRAMHLLLEGFRAAKPRPLHVWTRQAGEVDTPKAKGSPDARLAAIAQLWREEREAYPGWLLPPWTERLLLWTHTEPHLSKLRENLPNASPRRRAEFLRELVWRCEVSLRGYPEWLLQALAEASADPAAHGLDKTARLALLGTLTRAARERRDRAGFDDYHSRLANEAKGDSEAAAEAAYEACLWARDELDYDTIAEHNIQVHGSDPAWFLRRASLLCALNEYTAAACLVRDCLAQVRERRTRDRRSIWLLSREAWADWLMASAWFALPEHERPLGRADETWPTEYGAANCDPWSEFERIDGETRETADRGREAAVEEVSLFDAGELQFRTRSGRWHQSDHRLSLPHELRRLADHVGLPSKIGFTDIIGGRLARAVEAAPDSTPAGIWQVVLALESHSRGLIDQRFNRIEVARLPAPHLGELIRRLRASVEFGRARLGSRKADNEKHHIAWVEHLRVHVELLSRLVLRLTTDEALETFRWAATLAHDPHWTHWCLYRPLHHLLRRSLQAIPVAERSTTAFEILRLPLPAEKDTLGKEDDWPELSNLIGPEAVQIMRGGQEWDRRVAELIDGVRVTKRHSRTCAILRLSLLHSRKLLTIAEQQGFAAALWALRDTPEGLPSASDLYPDIFLELPEPEPGTAEKAFRHDVVHQLASGSQTADAAMSLAQACGEAGTEFSLAISDALIILDHLIEHPSSKLAGIADDGQRHEELWLRRDLERQQQANAYALANAILPSVSAADLGTERIACIFEILRSGEWPSLVLVLPRLAGLLPDRYAEAVTLVRRGLAGRRFEIVAPAMEAVKRWLKLGTAEFPAVLATDIISLCAVRREPGLHLAIHLARDLLEQEVISEPDEHRLIDSLEFLFLETAYDNWREGDLRTETLTLVRANCVRLARVLADRGRCDETLKQWLSEAVNDPIPEVRQVVTWLEDPP